MKTLQGNRCAALADRVQDAKTLMGSAITYQFMTGVVTSTQEQINAGTLKASALSNLISTAASAVNENCVSSLTDAANIQRLIGQVITLSGFFAGGWQGIGLAGAGTLLSSLPLFRSDADATLELISKYQEINKRGSFLCLYRQMQRTSCLLFAPPGSTVINGFDLTLQSGPAKTTNDSLDEIEKDPKGKVLIHDLTVIRKWIKAADEILVSSRLNLFKDASLDPFEKFKAWCGSADVEHSSIFFPDIYPDEVVLSFLNLYERCEKIRNWSWSGFIGSADALKATTLDSFKDLYILTNFYNSSLVGETPDKLKAPVLGAGVNFKVEPNLFKPNPGVNTKLTPVQEMAKVLNTLESKFYFLDLKEKIEAFHNPKVGNQERLNYLHVTETVGRKFARNSFLKIMRDNNSDLSRKRWFSRTLLRRDPVVRRKAVSAMISACQMFDPTLACLYGNRPEGDLFFRTWRRQCVGQKSRLCKTVVKHEEWDQLIPDPEENTYFRSLCGIKKWVKGRAAY
ncbi:MAG: hypothetical protein HYX41_02020 [Bdellovibrio sp.]|nr:hypothetical protein [Bdellovibrio sp.]